jgi:dipeptidase D
LRNAIPREAEVTLLIDPKDESKVKEISDNFVEEALKEFKTVDGDLTVKLESKDGNADNAFADEFKDRLVKALLALPHGVMAYSPDIPDLVETSTNLATINIEDGQLRVGTSQRSSIDTAKTSVSNSVKAVFELAGAAKVDRGSGYPGWQPNMDSALLKTSKKVYKDLFGEEPGVKAIHAGLETGLLGSKYPGMDMISFGPTIEGAHSPDEKINVKTVEKFYQLMKGILKELADK